MPFPDLSDPRLPQPTLSRSALPQSAPPQSALSQSAPSQSAASQSAPSQSAPSQSAPSQSAPSQSAPSQSAPSQSAPSQSALSARSGSDLPEVDASDPDQRRDGVLITRPEAGAADTAARVRALGLRPVVAPLLRICAIPRALPDATRLQAVLIASGNALPSLPAACHALPLLAVGNASAGLARSAGFAHVFSADGDAAALAELARRHCNPTGSALLLAAGRGQSLTLAATLRAIGFRVIRRATYTAVPARALPEAALAALRDQRLRAVLFFSAETARQFARLLIRSGLREAVRGIDACAIGEPAATAIQALPWRRVLRAAKPTQDAMLALLQ